MAEPIVEATKLCPKCNTTKPLREFGVYSRNKKDGRRTECKICHAKYKSDLRKQQKIIAESSVSPRISDVTARIIASTDGNELSQLADELKKWAEFKKIEERSTVHNTVNLPYTLLYSKRTHGEIIFEANESLRMNILKSKFNTILLDVGVPIMGTDDIDIITFDERCVAVLRNNSIFITNQQQIDIVTNLENRINANGPLGL
jgi:hypothetical protein